MEAFSQPSLVLAGRVQTCQETLFMSPVGIVCQLRDNRMVPKCEVYLTLKKEKSHPFKFIISKEYSETKENISLRIIILYFL